MSKRVPIISNVVEINLRGSPLYFHLDHSPLLMLCWLCFLFCYSAAICVALHFRVFFENWNVNILFIEKYIGKKKKNRNHYKENMLKGPWSNPSDKYHALTVLFFFETTNIYKLYITHQVVGINKATRSNPTIMKLAGKFFWTFFYMCALKLCWLFFHAVFCPWHPCLESGSCLKGLHLGAGSSYVLQGFSLQMVFSNHFVTWFPKRLWWCKPWEALDSEKKEDIASFFLFLINISGSSWKLLRTMQELEVPVPQRQSVSLVGCRTLGCNREGSHQ